MINVKLMTLSIVLYLWITEILGIQINTQLPNLNNDIFTLKTQNPINITIGQDFSIGISQFDINKLPNDLKIYEISQQKFINMFETLEKHSNSSQGQRIQLQNNIFECIIKNPTMQIMKTQNIFPQKPSNKFSYASEKSIILVPIRSRQLLYTLDTESMQLSVYHFTPQKMSFLSSAKVYTYKPQQMIVMASSSNEEQVYIFSGDGMWSIQTKTALTTVNRLDNGLNGFHTLKYPIDKLYHGAYNYLFGLKRMSAVYLIPQSQNVNSSLIIITKFGNTTLIPQDLYVDSRMIYILDLHYGIFIYKILGNGGITQYDYINWKSYGNLEIIAKQFSIFVRYVDQEEQKIVQFNYDSEQHFASLVRYFKNDQIVIGMSLQTVPVASLHVSYSSNQPFLFLTTDRGDIEIFPYNIDPRQIVSPHNGVKMHIEGVTDLVYLFQDLYMVSTSTSLLYLKIGIQKPHLQCMMAQSTGHIYYEIQFSSNISSCQSYQHAFKHKSTYNSNCKLVTSYVIYVDDPELSRFQKAVLYGIVFVVVVAFIGGLLCLIQWRNHKLSIIGRIKEEIIKFRDRHRRMQPFTEEQHEHHNKNEVQFELPETLQIPQPKN